MEKKEATMFKKFRATFVTNAMVKMKTFEGILRLTMHTWKTYSAIFVTELLKETRLSEYT